MARAVLSAASFLAVALALGFALIAASAPFTAQGSVEAHRLALSDFKAAAAFANTYRSRTGTNPSDDVMQSWAAAHGKSDIASTIGVNGAQPGNVSRVGYSQENSFHPSSSDQFVLSYWNGDFYECYSYPSGRTTLLLSWRAVMYDGGGWSAVVTLAGISMLFGLAGAWCWRKQRVLGVSGRQPRIA